MVKALLSLMRLVVTVPAFEFLGAVATVAVVALQAGGWWWLAAVAVLAFVKSFDLALKGK